MELDRGSRMAHRRRPGQRKARFADVHVELFLEALAHPVDRDFDGGLEVAREGRQELLFDRPCLRPILEADQAGIRIDQLLARPIDESDRFRLELIEREGGGRAHLLDPEFLRIDVSAGRRDRCCQPREQGGSLQAPHHEIFQ